MMRTIIFAIILMFSSTAFADDPREVCGMYSELAEIVLENRYDGVSMRDAYNAAQSNDFAERIVRAAYNLSYMRHPDNQRQQIKEFRDRIFSICLDIAESQETV